MHPQVHRHHTHTHTHTSYSPVVGVLVPEAVPMAYPQELVDGDRTEELPGAFLRRLQQTASEDVQLVWSVCVTVQSLQLVYSLNTHTRKQLSTVVKMSSSSGVSVLPYPEHTHTTNQLSTVDRQWRCPARLQCLCYRTKPSACLQPEHT